MGRMDEKPIYLDYNATTPIAPEVAEAMIPYLYEHFGNPSSSHAYGADVRKAVVKARARVAALLGCRAEEIVFTSGGSESNNAVIQGVARQLRSRGRHLITSAIEHPAILERSKHYPRKAIVSPDCRSTLGVAWILIPLPPRSPPRRSS